MDDADRDFDPVLFARAREALAALPVEEGLEAVLAGVWTGECEVPALAELSRDMLRKLDDETADRALSSARSVWILKVVFGSYAEAFRSADVDPADVLSAFGDLADPDEAGHQALRFFARLPARVLAGRDELHRTLGKLIERLRVEDEDERTGAAALLAQLGPSARDGVANLLEALRDPSEGVRSCALHALGSIDPGAPEVVAALPALLADPAPEVREQAAWVVWEAGPLAEDAAEAIAGLLTEVAPPEAVGLALLLSVIGPGAAAAVPALIACLDHRDGDVRAATAEALGRIGVAAPGAVDRLLALGEDGEAEARRAAAQALSRLAPDDPRVLDALRAALADREPLVRVAAAASLGRLAAAAAPAVEDLRRMLRDPALRPGLGGRLGRLFGRGPTAAERVEGLYALGRIGAPAAPALPLVIAGLRDTDPQVRQNAALAMGGLGAADAPAARAALCDLARQDEEPVWVRRNTIAALSELGSAAADAVPLLRELMADADWIVRANAAYALGRVGPRARDAAPELVAALDDPLVRGNAVLALGRVGADGAAADTLADCLTDGGEAFAQGRVAQALGRLGHATPAAVGALRGAAADGGRWVWDMARDALMALGEEAPDDGDAAAPGGRERALEDLLLHLDRRCVRYVDRRAERALAEGAPPRARAAALLAALREAVERYNNLIAVQSAVGLAELGGPWVGLAAPQVLQALRGARDDDTRDALLWSLGWVEEPERARELLASAALAGEGDPGGEGARVRARLERRLR